MSSQATARLARSLPALILLVLFFPLLLEWGNLAGEVDRISYVLLVPLLAAGLAWNSTRSGAEAVPPRSSPFNWPAIVLLLVATLLLALGSLSAIFTLSIAAFPLAIAAWVATFWGTAGLRRHGRALLLFAWMVPPPLPIFDWAIPQLVKASGAAALLLLAPFDSQATWIGNELEFRGWTLVVAEACSGSGALLIYWVLTLFLGGLFRASWRTVAAFMVLSLPFTLLINGIRIGATALILDGLGEWAVRGTGHEILGQVVVILGAAFLAWAFDWVVARQKRKAKRAKADAATPTEVAQG